MAEVKKNMSWPLGIGIIYGLFVVLLLIYLVYANFNSVDLVTKDYYAKDLNYQQQIDRQDRTSGLESGMTWQYFERSQTVQLQFPANIDPAQISGKIIFFRPSDAQLDNTVTINPNIDRIQEIDVGKLSQGMWRLKIFWQAGKTDYYNEGVVEIKSTR
jgi:hypothetical protein